MLKDTVYVVSGYMRSGTSMMMFALGAGGLEIAFNRERDERLNGKFGDDDYQPNPAGFYELGSKEYKDPDFPAMYKGKLIKDLFGGLVKLRVLKYQVVFMVRDPEEIRQSYEAFFGNQAPPHVQTPEKYHTMIEGVLETVNNRKDMIVTSLHYRDVIEHPLEQFEKLVDAGWPIDAEEATATVDPEQYRFRREHLTTGMRV